MRIDFDDVTYDDNSLVCYEGAPFTGEVVETAPTGEILAVTSYEHGYQHGPSTEWFRSGQMRAHGVSRYGLGVGVHRVWHQNGQLAAESTFDDAGIIVADQEWDEAGNPIPKRPGRASR